MMMMMVLSTGNSFDEAFEKTKQIAQDEGRVIVHAFNDDKIVAGQGTVGVELMEQNAFLVRKLLSPRPACL